jgi:hypothetical protein
MINFNTVLPRLIKEFPKLLTRKTIEKLVISDDPHTLSYESAAACIAEIDVAKENGSISRESEDPMDGADKGDFDTEKEQSFFLENAKLSHFANIKFSALVDFAKKDDSLLYTEFMNVDTARDRIVSEIVSKYENDFNSFLVALQATEGVDKSIIESLVQTKVHVGEIS